MREVSVGNNLTADVKQTVYTVPTGYYAKWNLCFINNASGVNKAVSVWWYDASAATEVVVINSYLLDLGKFIQFGGTGGYVVLEEGDQVRIKPELLSTMSSINTFELIRKG